MKLSNKNVLLYTQLIAIFSIVLAFLVGCENEIAEQQQNQPEISFPTQNYKLSIVAGEYKQQVKVGKITQQPMYTVYPSDAADILDQKTGKIKLLKSGEDVVVAKVGNLKASYTLNVEASASVIKPKVSKVLSAWGGEPIKIYKIEGHRYALKGNPDGVTLNTEKQPMELKATKPVENVVVIAMREDDSTKVAESDMVTFVDLEEGTKLSFDNLNVKIVRLDNPTYIQQVKQQKVEGDNGVVKYTSSNPLKVEVNVDTGKVIIKRTRQKIASVVITAIKSGTAGVYKEQTAEYTLIIEAPKWKDVTAASDYRMVNHNEYEYHVNVAGIRDDGTLWAWGTNKNGELGQGDVMNRYQPEKIGNKIWRAIYSGPNYMLGIDSEGYLYAWGTDIGVGRLGVGNKRDGWISYVTYVPEKVGSNKWKSIALSDSHVVGVQEDGRLRTWGWNLSLSLGRGEWPSKSSSPQNPHKVQDSNKGVWAVAGAGQNHSLALRDDGTLWAWGSHSYGELGIGERGDTTNIGTMPHALLKNNWKTIASASEGSHVAGISQDGTLWTWGNNSRGQLGRAGGNVDAPHQVGNEQWKQVFLGTDYTLAIQQNGTLWTWGNNQHGQLGNGQSGNSQATPKQVGDAKWIKTNGGGHQSVGIQEDGTMWIWGYNRDKTLGIGDTTSDDPFTSTDVQKVPEIIE